jgi:hypothetical protein
MSKINSVIAVFCFLYIGLAFWDIAGFVENAQRGLVLFGTGVLPILFPFFFISSLLVELDLFKKRGARTGVVFLSLLSGYPTGIRMLSQLYERGQITREQAIRTATFTSTASPIFIVATLGEVMYNNIRFGIIIFAAHVLGAILNGFLYGAVKFKPIPQEKPRKNLTNMDLNDILSSALYNAIQNVLAVGGLVMIFFVASAPLGLPAAALLEMTNGVFLASETPAVGIRQFIIPCAIVSFGGLCVALQGFVFLKNFRLPFWFYFIYKSTHTFFAVFAVIILYSLIY